MYSNNEIFSNKKKFLFIEIDFLVIFSYLTLFCCLLFVVKL